MSRLVIAKGSNAGIFKSDGGGGGAAKGDDYKARFLKYIPAESTAFYLFVDRMIASQYGIEQGVDRAALDPMAGILAWGVFLLTLVATPIYLARAAETGQDWKLNAVIATIAFVAWSYSLGGSLWVLQDWYQLFLAGLIAPVFTFLAALIEPKPA